MSASRSLAILGLVLMLAVVAGVVMYVFEPDTASTNDVELDRAKELVARLRTMLPGSEGDAPGGQSAFDRDAVNDLGAFPSVEGDLDYKLAEELLALQQRKPGRERYTVKVQIGADRHSLMWDKAGNAVIRVHKPASGQGQTRYWTGYAEHRLNSKARGGSLDATPDGPSPGKNVSF